LVFEPAPLVLQVTNGRLDPTWCLNPGVPDGVTATRTPRDRITLFGTRWLFCRDRWDLFCQRCSAIERDLEEWKVFKKTLKQLWKEPREITLKAAFVKL
jgi:hypothetical protein